MDRLPTKYYWLQKRHYFLHLTGQGIEFRTIAGFCSLTERLVRGIDQFIQLGKTHKEVAGIKL